MRSENLSDLPSFTASNISNVDDENFSMDSELVQRFIQDNSDLARIIALLSYNQGYLELLDQLVVKVDQALEQNRNYQKQIRSKLGRPADVQKQRCQVGIACWPPYFKDSIGMAPKSNQEALEISRICLADPLMEEEKRWNPKEFEQLRFYVCESLKDQQILGLESRKDLLVNKMRSAGVETTVEQKREWRDGIEKINKRIDYIRQRPMEEYLGECDDYSTVDWAKISARDFQGTRTIAQLRQRWCNDLSPLLNSPLVDQFTVEEDRKLIGLARDISNWDKIAEMLGTNRSAFRCFERFVYLQQGNREIRPWTQEEDQKLRQLILVHKVGEEIPWAKIAMYMHGRNKLSCEYRYTRSISEKLRHGRWTEAEDMVLLEAINKYGPQNWIKISDCLNGRSALQCRDRWIHVLDHKRRDQPWTWEEHQRLLYGVRLFGRDECAKIAKLIPGRNNMDVRMRLRLLIKYQIQQGENPNKTVVFRHFARNYLYCKTRRKSVLEQFGKYLEERQGNRKSQLASRLGLGHFVAKPTTGVGLDYTNVKKERTREFNQFIIQGSGRWIRVHHKNPNEYDLEDLMEELNQLSEETRDEALRWLEESDRRLEAEREEEKAIPDDPAEAKEHYDRMFPQQRLDHLSQQVIELLPPREHELRYYHVHKKRPAKIRIKKAPKPKLPPKPKAPRKKRNRRERRKTKLSILLNKIDELGEDDKDGLRWGDRLMVEIFTEIKNMEPDEQRRVLIAKLCYVIRQRVHNSASVKYRGDQKLKDRCIEHMCEFVREIVDDPPEEIPIKITVEELVEVEEEEEMEEEAPVQQPPPPPAPAPPMEDTKTLWLPPDWQNLSMKEMIKLKLSPQMMGILAMQAQAGGGQMNAQQQQPTALQSAIDGAQHPDVQFLEPQQPISSRLRRRRSTKAKPPPMDRFMNTVVMPVDARQQMSLFRPQPPPPPPAKQPRLDLAHLMPLSKILAKLLPPCSSTLNAVDIYHKKFKGQLLKSVNFHHYLEDLAKTDADQPGASTSQATAHDGELVTDGIRVTTEYALLRKRMYRLYFLPMAMIRAIKNEDNLGNQQQQERGNVEKILEACRKHHHMLKESELGDEQERNVERRNRRLDREKYFDSEYYSLPPIEKLNIDVNENERLEKFGIVDSHIDFIVKVKPFDGVPHLGYDTILFGSDRNPVGEIFEIFGTVTECQEGLPSRIGKLEKLGTNPDKCGGRRVQLIRGGIQR